MGAPAHAPTTHAPLSQPPLSLASSLLFFTDQGWGGVKGANGCVKPREEVLKGGSVKKKKRIIFFFQALSARCKLFVFAQLDGFVLFVTAC